MAADPVAVAASNNPLLKTLVAAVSGKLNPNVNLVDTLNGDEFTVFAPVDDAFGKIDPATIDKLKTDTDLLKKILTYHVVPGQLAPDAIDGEQTTVEGAKVTVSGSLSASLTRRCSCAALSGDCARAATGNRSSTALSNASATRRVGINKSPSDPLTVGPVAVGAPAQHAAGEVGNIGDAGGAQDSDGLR